jgi:antitoxin CptB
MILSAPERERIRWHCRRGMLELDLILNAFLEKHFDELESPELDAFRVLLACPDPQLLNLIMGHEEPVGRQACEVVARLRKVKTTVAA